MAKSLNSVNISGNLGADPEMRYTADGKAVTNFRIAVAGYNDRTDWISVVAFDKLGETVAQYLSKGSGAIVSGRLQTRSWDDKDTGAKRYAVEVVAIDVVFIGGKGERSEAPASTRSTGRNQPQPVADDDDIPF